MSRFVNASRRGQTLRSHREGFLRGLLSHLSSILYGENKFVVYALNALASLWRIIARLGNVALGLWMIALVSSFVTLVLTRNTAILIHPYSWAGIRFVREHPQQTIVGACAIAFLLLCSYIAYQLRSNESFVSQRAIFVLERVDRLNPREYLSRYVPVYVSRRDAATNADADEAARKALYLASTRMRSLDPKTPMGICVFGRGAQGATRLAWEAMQAVLMDWTFVRWPHQNWATFDIGIQHGKRIALWLDSLQDYANEREAPDLTKLPAKLAAVDARFVIIATCHDGEDERITRKILGSLLKRLVAIRLADTSMSDVEQLASDLGKQGIKIGLSQFDGTPGSLLTGDARTRARGEYPSLSVDAKRVLRAIQLLSSAGIDNSLVSRVRSTAQDVFGLEEAHWQDVRVALAQAGFVVDGKDTDLDRSPQHGESAVLYLSHVATPLVGQAVTDYPLSGASESDDWPRLRESLERRKDVHGLILLGNAYNTLNHGDLGRNRDQAVSCYRAALRLLDSESDVERRAVAQSGLGAAYFNLAELTAATAQRANLLEQAETAYRLALSVYTREHAPDDWARVQVAVGKAFYEQAELTAATAQRANLLEQAETAYRLALSVYTREHAPDDWATTNNLLGDVLLKRSTFVSKADRANLLRQGGEAYREALHVYDHGEASPSVYARS